MRFELTFLACAATALVAPAVAQPASDALTCAWPVSRDSDEAALVKSFGAGNVVHEDIDIGEGATEPASVIFPNDPKRRIEVLWYFADKRQKPKWITVRRGSTWTFSQAPPDRRRITVGASLADVEAINGRPFLINALGWALGGYALDWQGGALARAGSDCELTLVFEPHPKATDAAVRRASRGSKFKSTSREMRAVMPIVGSMSLSWRPPSFAGIVKPERRRNDIARAGIFTR
jgi:hypothetical protein